MPIELSGIQILIILGVALLVFGPKRLPGLGRSLGSGLREFRDGMRAVGEPAVPAPDALTTNRDDTDPAAMTTPSSSR